MQEGDTTIWSLTNLAPLQVLSEYYLAQQAAVGANAGGRVTAEAAAP